MEDHPRRSEVDTQTCNRAYRNTQPRLRLREHPERDAKRERTIVNQRTQYHEGDIAQPFSMRRLMADLKSVEPVHQPSSARRNEEGGNSRGIWVGMRTDDQCLQDTCVNHKANRANRAEAQKLIQGTTLGGAICK